MNKQFVVVVSTIASAAMITASCVSTPKTDFRKIANYSEVEAIAAQGKDYDFVNMRRARALSDEDVAKMASATNIKLSSAQILTGNDSAFDRKLQMIKNAKKSIHMVYFIYSSDDSSSKINQALIEKAKSGIEVTLLVDFVTNYRNLDLFSMLEREGGKKLKTYFYNVPTKDLVADANFMVLPCPAMAKPDRDSCFKAKKAILEKSDKYTPTPFARILLAGLYGKDVTALKVALGYGAEIDPNNYKNFKSEDGLETKQLLQLLHLGSEAILQNNLFAKIQLSIALMTMSDQLNPMINELTGRLPLLPQDENSVHGKLWDHITDYTHHKLVVVDGSQFQLGGRNIEDSYHLNKRPADSKTGKYIFIDTDFWAQTEKAGGAKAIEDSFDKMMNTSMVASLQKVKDITAFEFISNTGDKNKFGAAQAATQTCVQNKSPNLGACILQTLKSMPETAKTSAYESEKQRVDAVVEAMNASAKNYDDEYVGKGMAKPGSDFPAMSARDLQEAKISYLENVNYKKETMGRVTGSKIGSELENGKNIQAVWFRALENVCRVSRDKDEAGRYIYSEEHPARVIFNTAYLLMPSGLVHHIAKMMNNDYGDCSRVRVTFMTNSRETTDLAPINVLARYQLGVLFSHYQVLEDYRAKFNSENTKPYTRFYPKMDYYELASAENKNSLHTKTTLIGNDLIIGSANADVRSYYMDTNNAILIRNAKEMNAQYAQFVDRMISTGRMTPKINEFIFKSTADLRYENEALLKGFAAKYHQEKYLDPKHSKEVLNILDRAGEKITTATSRLVLFRDDYDRAGTYTEGRVDQYKFNKELNDLSNGYDALFKVF